MIGRGDGESWTERGERYRDDECIGGKRQRDGERGCGKESEVWERRRLSCLFEDKSERQRSEEVCICKRAHRHAGARTHTHA